jgi:hypothetical protein
MRSIAQEHVPFALTEYKPDMCDNIAESPRGPYITVHPHAPSASEGCGSGMGDNEANTPRKTYIMVQQPFFSDAGWAGAFEESVMFAAEEAGAEDLGRRSAMVRKMSERRTNEQGSSNVIVSKGWCDKLLNRQKTYLHNMPLTAANDTASVVIYAQGRDVANLLHWLRS